MKYVATVEFETDRDVEPMLGREVIVWHWWAHSDDHRNLTGRIVHIREDNHAS